jgi:hypothetical protein
MTCNLFLDTQLLLTALSRTTELVKLYLRSNRASRFPTILKNQRRFQTNLITTKEFIIGLFFKAAGDVVLEKSIEQFLGVLYKEKGTHVGAISVCYLVSGTKLLSKFS